MDPTTNRADAPREPTPTIDMLARALADAAPRRAALRRLAGVLVAMGLALPAGADAQRGHRRSAHQPDAASPASPRKHKHPCASGLTPCVISVAKHGKHHPHVCVDLETDPEHCGACDHACAADQACRAGRCACTPDCNRRVCGTDGCGGSCGECSGDDICTNGRCDSVCPDGQKYCNGVCIPSNQCCTDDDCPGGQPCVAGSCCTPHCDRRVCGDDGCGGSCGACADGKQCLVNGGCGQVCNGGDCPGGCACGIGAGQDDFCALLSGRCGATCRSDGDCDPSEFCGNCGDSGARCFPLCA